MSTLATVIKNGLASAIPAAGNAGCLYFATDTNVVYQDNGTTWVPICVSGGTPITTQGDLIVGGPGGSPQRLAAGTTGQVLQTNGSGALPTWVNASGGGGGASALDGIGGFGSNGTGILEASYSNTGTLSWGPFGAVEVDATHLITLVTGHIYRIVFYFTGTASGANLCLIAAGTSGGTSKGYFIGNADSYYVSGASYNPIESSLGAGNGALLQPFPQIAEVYLWVCGASNNRIWATAFGSSWPGGQDNSVDFTTSQLEIGFAGNSGQQPTAVYVYDLGVVPTS